MTKKLFDEKERIYQIAAICIRLDELQTKGAVLQKMGKPTKNGTRMTFAPVQRPGECEESGLGKDFAVAIAARILAERAERGENEQTTGKETI